METHHEYLPDEEMTLENPHMEVHHEDLPEDVHEVAETGAEEEVSQEEADAVLEKSTAMTKPVVAKTAARKEKEQKAETLEDPL